MLITPDDTPLQLTEKQANALRQQLEIMVAQTEDIMLRHSGSTQFSPAVERLLNCEPVMDDEFSERERSIVNLADAIIAEE